MECEASGAEEEAYQNIDDIKNISSIYQIYSRYIRYISEYINIWEVLKIFLNVFLNIYPFLFFNLFLF